MENLIYEIRGKQVILDSDLARLYQCKNGTKEINQAVKNNPNKFPERFSWVLTDEEMIELRSKVLTAKINEMSRANHRVFTEQGIAMLATILKSQVAVQVSIQIMDTFVEMRRYLSNNLIEQKYINNQVMKNTELIEKNSEDIRLLQESFDEFKEKRKSHEIYFDGQIYDAYSKILEIFREARKSLIIIDAYADKTMLDIIRRLKVSVKLIAKKNSLLSKQDIEKYNEQYGNLEVVYDDSFHDRYFILDGEKVFHCGASVNRIGYKTFSITEISDAKIIEALLNSLEKSDIMEV